jgi:hypothetical protein
MALATTPLVRELEQKTYDPKSRRYVLEYELTKEGHIVIDYELRYGEFADPTYGGDSSELRRASHGQATISQSQHGTIPVEPLTQKPTRRSTPQMPPIRG